MSKIKDQYLRWKYGITYLEYQDMWFNQQGRCGVCGTYIPGSKMVVDHCHSTGEIRGLLCTKCNTGLGKLGDCVEGLKKAIRYLIKCTR